MKSQKKELSAETISDAEIIELYWSRNEQAIRETDRKYGKYLFTIAYNIVHNDPDCEECLNDTYLGTWNRIPPTRPNVFVAFLSKIMRNVAVDRFRKNTADRRIPPEMIVTLNELDESMGYSEAENELFLESDLGKLLNDFLRSLSERERFMFVCRYYYADTIPNVAGMLGISPKTVYRELAILRQRLKELLVKEGFSRE